MNIIDGKSEIASSDKTRIAIGKFDGVHLGHRKLISEITNRDDSVKSLVFTFSYDSEYAYRNENKLLAEDERRNVFESLGVEYLVEFKLDKEGAMIPADVFVKDILVKRLHGVEIVAGADVSFGYKGMGDADLLYSMGKDLGFKVTIIDKVTYKGEEISSSRIRNAIAKEEYCDADFMLGRNI